MKVNILNKKFVKRYNPNSSRKARRCEARNRNNHSIKYRCYCGLHKISNIHTLESESEQHADNE